MDEPRVDGEVAAGWEAVRTAFVENFRDRGEVGAACAVYHRGEKVVDLWGGLADPATGRAWKEDTLVLVFSTTKGMSSMAVALAHTRGLFDYDDRVCDRWPAFAAAGKEGVTIRQLLSHQAGLSAIDRKLDLEALADPDRLADALATQAPKWEPGTHHGYHALTLGFYESQLIRNVDPKHRTIGRFFAEEVAAPLGLEFYVGLPDHVDRDRIARILGDNYALRMVFNLHKLPPAFVLGFMNPFSITNRSFSNPAVLGQAHRYNDEDMRKVELPASNGIGRVRDIAKAYGDLARGAPTLGLGATTREALEQVARPPSQGTVDLVLRAPTLYSLGYSKPFPGFEFGSSSRAFGTPGAGGSFGYADPDQELGFAYGMNRMDFYLWSDPREVALSRAAQACAAQAAAS